MKIEEILVEIGFELDKKSLKEISAFEKSLKSAAKTIAAVVGGIVASSAALFAFTKVMSNSVDELSKTARALDLEASALDNLHFAMEIATGSSQGLDSSLSSLSKHISEASRGVGSGLEVFSMLGVEVLDAEGKLKKVDAVLGEVLKATRGLESTQRLEFMDKLGLGGLSLSSKDLVAFNDALKEASTLSVISEEDTRLAAEFNDEVSKVIRVVRDFSVLIASTLSPAMKDISEGFKEWMLSNRELFRQNIAETFETLGKMVGLVASVMLKALGLTIKIVQALGGLNVVLKVTMFVLGLILAFSVGKALTLVIALVAKLIPLLTAANARLILVPAIIGGLVALIVLAIDELATFAKGGETLFQRLFKLFPAFEDTVTEIIGNIMFAWGSFVTLLTNPLNSANWVRFMDSILGLFGTTMDAFVEKVKAIVQPIRESFIELGLLDGVTKATQNEVDRIRNMGAGGGPGRTVHPSWLPASDRLASAGKVGASSTDVVNKSNAQKSSNSTTQLNSTQKVEVTIKGDASGLDKASLTNEIKKAVEDSNREALRNIETGIKK